MTDLGFTHVALFVRKLEPSLEFYSRFTRLVVTHRRNEPNGSRAAHLNDGHSSFSLVLVQPAHRSWRRRFFGLIQRKMARLAHLGVACESAAEVDSLCELARQSGCLRQAAKHGGDIVGYYALIADPDGNDLEVAYGQEMIGRLHPGKH